jgi:TniQ
MKDVEEEKEPQPLAFAVKPQPDEAFDSWMIRLAERHQIRVVDLFRHLKCDPELAKFDLARGKLGLPLRLHSAFDSLIEEISWAVGLHAKPAPSTLIGASTKRLSVKAIEKTFVGCSRDDLLPPALRSIGCAQCWLDWLASGTPWRIERRWILRVTLICERHELLLTDLRAVLDLGRGTGALRLLEQIVDRTRAEMERFAFIQTRLTCNAAISRAQIRGRRISAFSCSQRYLAALIGNRFHFAPARHLLLAALHSRDIGESERMEAIFSFASSPPRHVPIRKPGGVAPRLSDLLEAIARIGHRELFRKHALLEDVVLQLEQAWRAFPAVQASRLRQLQRAALAREVRSRYAAEIAAATLSPVTALRGLQDALFYLKDCGFADDTFPLPTGCPDPWEDCLDDAEALRARLTKRFAHPAFRAVLALPNHDVVSDAFERASRRSISAMAASNSTKLLSDNAGSSSLRSKD